MNSKSIFILIRFEFTEILIDILHSMILFKSDDVLEIVEFFGF
jgi:hypothetical protein